MVAAAGYKYRVHLARIVSNKKIVVLVMILSVITYPSLSAIQPTTVNPSRVSLPRHIGSCSFQLTPNISPNLPRQVEGGRCEPFRNRVNAYDISGQRQPAQKANKLAGH
jgi:hypothetical protein